MAGKNTAVFGIYPDFASVERAVPALREAGFRSTDISVLFPENVVPRISVTRRHPKRRKGRRPAAEREQSSAAHSGGSPASGRWPFPGWVPSLPQVR